MPDDSLFPIDQSTAQESKATFNDAALLAQLAHVPNATGFVVQGLEFSVDLNASPPLLSVSGGWARMYDSQGPTRDHTAADPPGSQAITVIDQTLPLQIGQRTGIKLEPGGENYVYLIGDRSGVEDNGYEIRNVENDPDSLSLLVGTVDTSAATATKAIDDSINRLPEGAYATLRVENEPTEPTDVARQADLTAAAIGDHDHGGERLGKSKPVASATIDRASIGGLAATLVAPASPTLQNQRRAWSWSDIPWEDKGTPIEDGNASASPDGAAYPAVINAAAFFDTPLDTYHMYWSGHDSPAGINLSTAPDPWGPWTWQQQVIAGNALGGAHVASPSAVVDPEHDRLNLYVHSNASGQNTFLQTAPRASDGTSFTDRGVVLDTPRDGTWDDGERSYFRARRIGSTWWGVYQGDDLQDNVHGIGVAHSPDGIEWIVEPEPAFDNTQWAGDGQMTFLGGGPSLSTVGGTPMIHYRDQTTDKSHTFPLADRDTAPFTPGEVVYEPPAWVSGGVAAYEFWVGDEYLFMYYYVAANPLKIGLARAPLEAIA